LISSHSVLYGSQICLATFTSWKITKLLTTQQPLRLEEKISTALESFLTFLYVLLKLKPVKIYNTKFKATTKLFTGELFPCLHFFMCSFQLKSWLCEKLSNHVLNGTFLTKWSHKWIAAATTWKQINKTKLENFICNISKNLTLRIEQNSLSRCSYNKYFGHYWTAS